MDTSNRQLEHSWFRSRGGRRFGIEVAAIVVVKLILLAFIWFVCFRPHPRPDLRPAAIENHLLTPTAEVAHDR